MDSPSSGTEGSNKVEPCRSCTRGVMIVLSKCNHCGSVEVTEPYLKYYNRMHWVGTEDRLHRKINKDRDTIKGLNDEIELLKAEINRPRGDSHE